MEAPAGYLLTILLKILLKILLTIKRTVHVTMLSDDRKTLDNPPFPCRALDFADAAVEVLFLENSTFALFLLLGQLFQHYVWIKDVEFLVVIHGLPVQYVL